MVWVPLRNRSERPRYISPSDAAEILGLSRKQVVMMCNRGVLASRRDHERGHRRLCARRFVLFLQKTGREVPDVLRAADPSKLLLWGVDPRVGKELAARMPGWEPHLVSCGTEFGHLAFRDDCGAAVVGLDGVGRAEVVVAAAYLRRARLPVPRVFVASGEGGWDAEELRGTLYDVVVYPPLDYDALAASVLSRLQPGMSPGEESHE